MNPRRIKANLTVDLKEFIRNKAAVFWTLLFPILLILLFGFIFQGEDDVSYNLSIQDKDEGNWSTNLITILKQTDIFEVDMVDPEKDPENYMEDNNIDVLLIIPDGYSEQINEILAARVMGEQINITANLTILYDPSQSNSGAKIQILDSVIQRINKGFAGASDTIGIQTETTLSEEFTYIDFFAPGIIAMSVMASSLFGTVTINTELRQKGILRKLATTPITRPEWLISNILYQLVMALFSTIAILVVGNLVFGLKPHLNLFLPLFVLLTVFAFSGTGMLITRFVKEAQSAEAAANAVMFPMMFLAGTFFPLEMMPDFLQHIARVLPLYYINEGLRDAMFHLNFESAIINAIVIGVFGIVVFILGIFLTSWKEE